MLIDLWNTETPK